MHVTTNDSNLRASTMKTFQREANILATLNHPAIPKIYDFFEKNDYYAVVFSIIAASTIIYGNTHPDFWYLTYFGLGVSLYGISYFVFHDLIVHRRIKFKYTAKSEYMKRIMNAHYVHHKVHTKEGAEAFGFLFAPKKYDIRKKRKVTISS